MGDISMAASRRAAHAGHISSRAPQAQRERSEKTARGSDTEGSARGASRIARRAWAGVRTNTGRVWVFVSPREVVSHVPPMQRREDRGIAAISSAMHLEGPFYAAVLGVASLIRLLVVPHSLLLKRLTAALELSMSIGNSGRDPAVPTSMSLVPAQLDCDMMLAWGIDSRGNSDGGLEFARG